MLNVELMVTIRIKQLLYVWSIFPQCAVDIHNKCINIQNDVADMLKPGAIPSEIYSTIMNRLDKDFLQNFMGYGNRQGEFHRSWDRITNR